MEPYVGQRGANYKPRKTKIDCSPGSVGGDNYGGRVWRRYLMGGAGGGDCDSNILGTGVSGGGGGGYR